MLFFFSPSSSSSSSLFSSYYYYVIIYIVLLLLFFFDFRTLPSIDVYRRYGAFHGRCQRNILRQRHVDPEPGQRKAKDLLYLVSPLDGSMASIALDDDSQNSTDSSNLNVDEIWKSMNSDLPKTSVAMGVAGGQQSVSVQAMLNKISATAKKKRKRRKKK